MRLSRPANRCRTWPRPLVIALSIAAAGPSRADTPAPPKIASEAPRDPNDTPMMRAPNGQPQPRPIKRAPALTPPYSGQRRLALTLSPTYASFRLPLLGRPTIRRPGAGLLLEADLRLLSFVWLRAQVAYSGHPMDETKSKDKDTEEISITANAGMLHTATAGIGAVIGVDLGRFLPMVDIGAGIFRIGTPQGLLPGQSGMSCLDGTICDTGLTCNAGTCVPSFVPEVHVGLAVDLQLRKHWFIGASIRYFALMLQPRDIPIYVLGAARVGTRF